MNLDVWFFWYKLILEEFGFKREDDEKSAKILNEILEYTSGLSPDKIHIKKNVIVLGAGPSLKKNIIEIKDFVDIFTVIAADGATSALLEENIIPDIIVTDLDGKIEDIIKANNEGAVLAVHAHGNNMDKIKRHVKSFKNVIGTTQSTPLSKVYNFGGFTDGDRCVFLAIELGAEIIILGGMDFGNIVTRYSRPDLDKSEARADKIKQKKLEFARKLIEWAALNENVLIFNISYGESIEGVKNVNLEFIKSHIKNYLSKN